MLRKYYNVDSLNIRKVLILQ